MALSAHGARAVAAFIANFPAQIHELLLGESDIVLDALAVHQHAARAFVERELGLDQVAMFLQQPIDAVVGTAAFLVGGERENQVAVGLDSLRA